MGRVISYGEKTGYNDGDYLLLDNGEGGTKRIRADRVGIQLDPTLTDPNKAAPANAVKPVDATPTQGSTNAVSSGGVYDTVITLKNGLEYKNWFSKYDTYSVINASGGSAPNSNVLNADGSITCNTSMGAVGQRLFKSNDQTKILKPGKYTISCRVTFADNSPSGQKQMVMRVGREYSNYSSVYVMTERGGSTRIDGDVKTGWAMATIEVTGEEVFVFECLPQSSTYSSLSMTTIIDHIQVESGERLTEYSEQIYFYEKPAMDVAYSAVDLVNELSYKRNIFVILKNNRKPYFDGVNRKLIFAGDSLYLSANNASYVSIDYTTIQAQISSYSSITSNGLEIQLPSVGVFGYDIVENAFKVFTTFNTPFSFEPLAYRYYNIQWGKLIDYAQGFELERAIYNNNHIIYTTQTAEHSFTRNGSNGEIVWHSSGKLNTRVYLDAGTSTVAPEWADISQDISDKIVVDGSNADITIPSYSMLVYNTVDGKLHIKSINVKTLYDNSDIVLVFNTWANPVKGLLYDEYINRNVENNIKSMVDANTVRAQSFNSSYHVGATDFANKCKEFSNLLLGDSINNVTATTDFEAFLFFTDPHLLQPTGWENLCYEFISQIQKYYNSTPTTFCLCGGDWLGNSDLPDEACYKMGYIDGFMHSMFDNCYMLVGNHDTNYQGKKDSQSATYTTRLSNQSIANLWYRKNNNKTYFSFNGANTKFYCFDTGTEGQTLAKDNNYGWAQAQWFASSLLSENFEHIAIAAHILYYDTDLLQPLTSTILDIADAYNNRTSINVNGTPYNYSSVSGKIEFGIFGHKHADELHTINNIPCIMTTNVRNNESLGASFDLVLVDYDGGIIKLVRVGSGDNREISLV